MKSRIKALFAGSGSDIFKNILILLMGTGAAKIVGLAVIPVLTRIYSPGDFGIVTAFMSVVYILTPLLCLRYILAVPLPRRDEMALNLMALNAALMLTLFLVLCAVAALMGEWLLDQALLGVLKPYLWLLPLAILISASYELLSFWATRKKKFKVVAQTQFQQSIYGAVSKVVLGVLSVKPAGLVIGQIIQIGGGLGVLLRGLLADKAGVRRARIRLRWMRLLLAHYADFPKYRLPSQLLLVFAMQAPVIFVLRLYGVEASGQLGLALSTIAVPMTLIGSAASNAYYAEVSRIGRRNPGKIMEISKDIVKKLALVAIAPCLVLFALGPQIFSIVFGAQWVVAGELAASLSLFLLFQFASAPLINVLTVFGKQGLFFAINIVRTIVVVSVFAVAKIFEMSLADTIQLYALGLLVHYAMVALQIFRVIKAEMVKDNV